MKQFFYLSLLWMIYLFSISTYHVLGHNEQPENHNKNNDLTLEQWINTASFALLSMLIGIVLTFLMIYFYHERHNQVLVEKENETNQTNIIRDINQLPNFKAIKPYTVLFIHRTQSHFVLDELIVEARKTKIFTIVPQISLSCFNYMFIHIELVQDSQTILALIEYFSETDRPSIYYNTLRRLFTIIFDTPNTIQTWGNIIHYLKSYQQYGLFSLTDVIHAQSNDIQQQFKTWYNQTFGHHIQCHQYLKYDEIDSSLCSCAHRPYRSSSNQWSISKAITYTFDEQFNNHIHGTHQSLAITKLAHVVNGKWTIQQLKDYKQNYNIEPKVND